MKPDLLAAVSNLGAPPPLSLHDLDHVALPPPSVHAPKVDSPLDASDELDGLTGLALKRLKEVLSEVVDLSEDKQVKAVLSAAGIVLNTQVRVDEGRLKRRKLDALPKLLEIIAREEGRMGRVATQLLEAV